jgi:spoIIIJ-associated protein
VESIEASGKSVEEAIARALASLGKRRDEVEIAVLQEASRGTFGLGSKEARVRVTVRSASTTSSQSTRGAVITPEMADALLGPAEIEVPLPENEEELVDEEDEDYSEEEELDEEEEEELELEDMSLPFIPAAEFAHQPLMAGLEIQSIADSEQELQDVQNASREDIEITVDVLQHILRHMNIHAAVQVRSNDPLTVNIHGMNENLGLLIGRRGETLAALQLLVNLIVSHRTKHRLRIVVDAENYRQRREENLRSLALRVAQQVRNHRRSIALEAMSPYERRIVHIALSDSKDISTESIGEGDERRVVISLKRPGR